MMSMPCPDFIERYTGVGGPASRVEAMRIARAGLQVLSCALPVADRRLITTALPAGLAEVCRGDYLGPDATLADAVERFSAAANLSHGAAIEQLQVLCAVVAERLDPSQRTVLRGRLPSELGDLLMPPRGSKPPALPDRAGTSPHAGHTLADGHPDRAHSGSVARWDGSRTQHTLGGYTGPEGTLADGKPGPSDTLGGD